MTFSRSRGKGGQNVNKVSTKATLKWNVFASAAVSEGQKARIADKLASRMDGEGNIVLYSQGERIQQQNRADAVSKLYRLVEGALRVPKIRKPTRATRASKERRLDKKKKLSQKKEMRKKIMID